MNKSKYVFQAYNTLRLTPLYKTLFMIYKHKYQRLKNINSKTYNRKTPTDLEYINEIPDAGTRAWATQIVAQKNGYRDAYNRVLAKEKNQQLAREHQAKTLLLKDLLFDDHIEALRHAISDKFAESMNWEFDWDNTGAVIDNGTKRKVYRIGYLQAIKTVLDLLDEETTPSTRNNLLPNN